MQHAAESLQIYIRVQSNPRSLSPFRSSAAQVLHQDCHRNLCSKLVDCDGGRRCRPRFFVPCIFLPDRPRSLFPSDSAVRHAAVGDFAEDNSCTLPLKKAGRLNVSHDIGRAPLCEFVSRNSFWQKLSYAFLAAAPLSGFHPPARPASSSHLSSFPRDLCARRACLACIILSLGTLPSSRESRVETREGPAFCPIRQEDRYPYLSPFEMRASEAGWGLLECTRRVPSQHA